MSQQNYLHILANRISALEKRTDDHILKQNTNLFNKIYTGTSWVDFNIDIIARTQLVLHQCGPLSLLATNEHKQLVSTSLSDWITGTDDQIFVHNNNGKIKLFCPQNISPTSTPIFKQIRITNNPIDDQDVVTKKYLDDLLLTNRSVTSETISGTSTKSLYKVPTIDNSTMDHETIDLKRLNLNNTDGHCLHLEKNSNIYMNVDLDQDGTILLNNKTGDIDIYSKKISLLSNIDSTSPNDGSVVIYGGMGVVKNLCVGEGILLKTNDGIPSKLDYFEYGSLTMHWSGLWKDYIDGLIVYQRMGIHVVLTLPYVGRKVDQGGEIIITPDTYLPERLRPIYDISLDIDIIEDDVTIPGKIYIYGKDGHIIVKKKVNNICVPFNGSGLCGFHTIVISFLVNFK